jgi:hypothetical protein
MSLKNDGIEDFLVKYNLTVSEYVEVEDIEENKIKFSLIAKPSSIDDTGHFDVGLLLGIIDTFSTFAGFVFRTGNKIKQNSLSINLKLTNFTPLIRDNKYKMVVHLKKQQGNYASFESEIFDNKGILCQHSVHLVKLVKQNKHKF